MATHVAGYAPVPNIGWTVIVERPEVEVLAPARKSWNLALAGLGSARYWHWDSCHPGSCADASGAGVSHGGAGLWRWGCIRATAALTSDANELGILVTTFAGMRQAVAERRPL